MSDLTPKNRLEENLLKMKEQGLRPTLADAGIHLDPTENYELVSTLARIGDDMIKAIDDVTISYLVKYFPQLRGMPRGEALDWLKRKKVMFSAVKSEHAVEGGNVLLFAVFSRKYNVRRCYEVRSQVLSDITKPGKVALKIAHKEVPFPEDLGIVERGIMQETQ